MSNRKDAALQASAAGLKSASGMRAAGRANGRKGNRQPNARTCCVCVECAPKDGNIRVMCA